jgi:hypothetical protein
MCCARPQKGKFGRKRLAQSATRAALKKVADEEKRMLSFSCSFPLTLHAWKRSSFLNFHLQSVRPPSANSRIGVMLMSVSPRSTPIHPGIRRMNCRPPRLTISCWGWAGKERDVESSSSDHGGNHHEHGCKKAINPSSLAIS